MQLRIHHPRRHRRWIIAGTIIAAVGVVVWVAARWWPTGLRPGWTGTQQAATVADVVGAGAGVLVLAVALLAWLFPRPAQQGKASRLPGPPMARRVPQPAERMEAAAGLAGTVMDVSGWRQAKSQPPTVQVPAAEASSRGRSPRLGAPIGQYTPLVLEVHQAIESPGGDDRSSLPSYVPRAHDVLLRDVVAAAAGGSSRIADSWARS